jgi:hypothetical protein
MRSLIVGTAGTSTTGRARSCGASPASTRPPEGREGARDHDRPGLRPSRSGRRPRRSFIDVPGHERFVPQHAGGRPRDRRRAAGGGRGRVGHAPDPRALPHLPPPGHPARAWWPSPSATPPTRTCRRWPSWKCASSSRVPSWRGARPPRLVADGEGLDELKEALRRWPARPRRGRARACCACPWTAPSPSADSERW